MGILGRIDTFITWFDGVRNHRYRKYRWCGNRDRSRRTGSVILDDPDRIFRNGNKVFRRSSGSKIPYDR